jgi:hypothetical protein
MSAIKLRVIRFWTEYETRGGKTVEKDWVEFCAPGQAQLRTNVTSIGRLKRVLPNPDPDNEAAMIARDTWEAIRPQYEAWKQGQELPETGTPLAAWAGINAAQAEEIKKAGLRTIEEVADANDSILGAINLPGTSRLRDLARAWIESRSDSKVTDALAEREAELAAMREEVAEMTRLMAEAQEDKPKRGRKPLPRDENGNVIREDAVAA